VAGAIVTEEAIIERALAGMRDVVAVAERAAAELRQLGDAGEYSTRFELIVSSLRAVIARGEEILDRGRRRTIELRRQALEVRDRIDTGRARHPKPTTGGL
jgi:hypothetical protein